MYGIEVLVEEHDNVLRLTTTIRKMLADILEDNDNLDLDDMRAVVDIIRNYTDKHHHGKEEEILFKYMLDELGAVAEKIVRNGMLVQHDQARATVRDWSEAIDSYEQTADIDALVNIVGSAYQYAKLLEGHVDRENAVVYTFAERQLKAETLDKVNEDSRAFEDKAAEKGIQEKYLKMIDDLEDKYVG